MPVIQDLVSDVVNFAKCKGITYDLDTTNLKNQGHDFGHIFQGKPRCILQPQSIEELTEILREANHKRFTLTPRGRGLSQSGQSISPKGISLDLSCYSNITSDPHHPGQVRCGGGATWRQVMQHSAPLGFLPLVMPLNLDLTIAGTLSAGGFGATSYRFGPAIAHVLELEVITGAGERVQCSQTHRKEVFHSALGGLGRCGIIASAMLNLRSFKPKIQTYYLLYSDLEEYLGDQEWLSEQKEVNYLEGFCSSSVQGLKLTTEGRKPFFHWQYGLHVGIEVDNFIQQSTPSFLSELHHQQLLRVEVAETTEFLTRYDARFQQMHRSQAWGKPHPWFECFMPLDIGKQLIPQFLEELPYFFGDGHRIMYCSRTEASPIFMQPKCSSMVAFAVLPTDISSDDLPEALQALAQLNQTVIDCGGKRYLSGWLGKMTTQSWMQHFDEQYDYWRSLKTKLDPNNILQSVLFQDR